VSLAPLQSPPMLIACAVLCCAVQSSCALPCHPLHYAPFQPHTVLTHNTYATAVMHKRKHRHHLLPPRPRLRRSLARLLPLRLQLLKPRQGDLHRPDHRIDHVRLRHRPHQLPLPVAHLPAAARQRVERRARRLALFEGPGDQLHLVLVGSERRVRAADDDGVEEGVLGARLAREAVKLSEDLSGFEGRVRGGEEGRGGEGAPV